MLRKDNLFRALLVMMLAVVMAGCQQWTRIDEGKNIQSDNEGTFEVEVPTYWVRHNFDREALAVTKDSPELQMARFMRRNTDKPFNSLEGKLPESPLVTDLADYYLADLKERMGGIEVEKLALTPATLAGETGFRMELRFFTERGLEMKQVAYGVLIDGAFYELFYQAPNLIYFERDLPTFEQMVESFKPKSA